MFCCPWSSNVWYSDTLRLGYDTHLAMQAAMQRVWMHVRALMGY